MSETQPLRGGGLLLLMLCPALAVSDTVVNALGFGAIVLIAAPLAALMFVVVRGWLAPDSELPAALLLLAGVFSALELLLRAYFHELYSEVGLWAPIATVNCVVVGALTLARPTPREALTNVLKASAGIALIVTVLGVARELVGRGSLLHGAGSAFGDWAAPLEVKVFSVDMGFLLGMLPPGAFIALGLLIAIRNWASRRA